MKSLLKLLSRHMVCSIILIIAILELIILIRHDVIKNSLIARGYLKQVPEERADYHCLLGWENTLEKMDYKADICFLGNSITFHSDFQKDYPEKKIVNLGYSGDDIEGMIIRNKQVASVKPDKIFVMAGYNDLMKRHISIDDFKELYKQLIDTLKQSNPQSELYLESILPVNHQINSKVFSKNRLIDANHAIKELADEYSLKYIDLFSLYADQDNELPQELTSDGVHLNLSAYKRWSDALKIYLE